MASAELYFRQKLILEGPFMRDIFIWKVPPSRKYPEGVKYRLALINPLKDRVHLLFDNHFPKGHHIHYSTGIESAYTYKNLELLITDYLRFEEIEVNRHEDNEDRD